MCMILSCKISIYQYTKPMRQNTRDKQFTATFGSKQTSVVTDQAFRMNIPRTAADTTPDPPEDVKKKYCEDNDSST